MNETCPSLPPVRPPHVAARQLLVALASALALVAGCGGRKAAESPAGVAVSTSPPQPGESTGAVAPAASASTPATAAVDLGSQVFVKRCVLCHGVDGRGDGVASKGLNPKPRNFIDQSYMGKRTDAQLLEVIHKGKGVMPRWEGQLTEAEMKAVLAHIRSLGAIHR